LDVRTRKRYEEKERVRERKKGEGREWEGGRGSFVYFA